ncbi:chemotaxis protein CheA [Sphingomonas bacterium]|uniref:chemotaxis protein CheA n=1 Tax=Sphingomonas bacterium TaxID=1895847 RepID=UPI00157759F4|nr:chemotaxis protein CheW [Sphingomonas bacterium]
MDDLLQEFIAETRETLAALSGEIVAWESMPADRSRLDSIFRFVHTVKGSCGFLDLPRLLRLSHFAEDVLAAVRDGVRIPDAALVSAVLAIVDRIGEVVEAIDAGIPLDDSSEDLLIAALAEDAAPAAAPVAQTMVPRAPTRSIRLNVDLLDRMMSGMSDMVLARNELARRLRDEVVDPRVETALERLSLTVAEMRETVTRTRMQKIEALFSALPRMVRDTAGELGKSVTLDIDGADVELDREMIEMMRDPLVHIIRNAVDHGLESPADRRTAGKRDTGQLTVSARQAGNQIVIEIADDGRGIDVAAVAAKAVARGLHTAAQVAAMDEAQKVALVFEPGLSSRDSVTSISGRGVGMDVVRANIEHIGGRILLQNRPRQGLTIVILVPLTLSILPTIVVGVGGERFALARQSVEEIVKLSGASVRTDVIGGRPVVTVRGRRLPLVDLAGLIGVGTPSAETLAIVSTRDGTYALAIEAVLDTEELVVKPAAPAVMATGLYAGQTLPDSGLPMLLLDGAGIAKIAGLRFDQLLVQETEVAQTEAPGVAALLFEDLDGRRRVMPLAAIDRVEQVEAAAVRHSAGRLRIAIGGNLILLHAVADHAVRPVLTVLRLTDGVREIGYAVADPIEIVTLPADTAPAYGNGPIAGVVMIEGEQVELIDIHAMFAGEEGPVAGRTICLLNDDAGGWMRIFLQPALEASGYRCVTEFPAGERPAIALAMEGAVETPGLPTLRLRRDVGRNGPDDASIYRYDRAALLDAIATHVRTGKAA